MTEPAQYYQSSYVPYTRNNDIRNRGYSSDWHKMQNRANNDLSTMEGKAMEGPVGQKPRPNQKRYEDLLNSQSVQPSEAFLQSAPLANVARTQPPLLQASTGVAQSSPYLAFTEPHRTDTHYSRYMQLSQNVAHTYPNPGRPRQREGCIGGSWRHIKEVLGSSGSRVVFVDGLVSLYDMDKRALGRGKSSLAMRASLSTPMYNTDRRDTNIYGSVLRNDLEKDAYQPWQDKINNTQPFPPVNTTTQELPGSPSKYKGFYNINK